MSWKESNDSLTKTFVFKSFEDAMNWMQKAAKKIDQLNHHPEWTNIYNTIHVKLNTHDAGGIVTEKDHQLASILDDISTR
ncbi:MAG: pterin-4-alpha-carbinolamine dehydratase [Bacteroidetes bacterium MED-G17]|nr:MAG: pterin-4-alpha-carbinolamine dehydratase [Bacteroidetes bacterium MED-G17]CAI8298187.1 MAG: Putative pterin-4-alpha-carbinolamine dehydratase [Bacteroidetes bacterium MED-G17]|tara:strand:- start:31649 stop:31888 length:240 start_codon:yes stop_codon:yes gene_type:complete